MDMKELPIGVQTFEDIVSGNIIMWTKPVWFIS